MIIIFKQSYLEATLLNTNNNNNKYPHIIQMIGT